MATTTPNYGWAVPTSTDLVKDGATAIETLGDAIDASMNTALGTKKAGMVLLNTTSFSAVASQSINDVFSATYDNYKVIINLTAAGADLSNSFRFRVSGADNSTANYNKTAFYTGSDASTGTNNGIGQTLFAIGSMDTTAPTFSTHEILICNPFSTAITTAVLLSNYKGFTGTSFSEYTGWNFAATTSFTGFSIFTSTSNVTGTIQVFGVNK
jgi:hypothetical protein